MHDGQRGGEEELVPLLAVDPVVDEWGAADAIEIEGDVLPPLRGLRRPSCRHL